MLRPSSGEPAPAWFSPLSPRGPYAGRRSRAGWPEPDRSCINLVTNFPGKLGQSAGTLPVSFRGNSSHKNIGIQIRRVFAWLILNPQTKKLPPKEGTGILMKSHSQSPVRYIGFSGGLPPFDIRHGSHKRRYGCLLGWYPQKQQSKERKLPGPFRSPPFSSHRWQCLL